MRRLGIGDPDERVKWDDLAELRLITDLPSLLPLQTTNELDLDFVLSNLICRFVAPPSLHLEQRILAPKGRKQLPLSGFGPYYTDHMPCF